MKRSAIRCYGTQPQQPFARRAAANGNSSPNHGEGCLVLPKLGLHHGSLFGLPGLLRAPWLIHVALACTFVIGRPIAEP